MRPATRRAGRRPKAVLVETLREAGAVVRRGFGRGGFTYKTAGSPGGANLLTETDQAAQKAVLGRLLRAFPEHGYLAEEGDDGRPARKDADWMWLVDPLDGTTNFAHTNPVCCVSIALTERGRPVLSGVYDPFRDELFLAERGHGATLNGRPMRVSRTRTLRESLLVTGFPYDRHRRPYYYTGLYARFLALCHDVRRSGSAALDLAWTACGRMDGFWEFKLAPWDVAAGRLLVEEAGGRVSDFSGRSWKGLADFGPETLASNGRIHAAMLRTLRRSSRSSR